MTDEPEKLELRSSDIAEEKRQELLRLFPETRTEGGKLDFERLCRGRWRGQRRLRARRADRLQEGDQGQAPYSRAGGRRTEGEDGHSQEVRCGQRHFEAIGVPFDVVVSADEV